MTALLSLQAVSKRFGSYQALDRISLDVRQGEFIALLGPSGCGKTTLLRAIAGFQTPDSGRIAIDGEDVTQLPPYRRPLNTVFQQYALFPHMRVIENVAYGPRRQGVARDEAAKRSRDALEMVGLENFGARYPRELSGGQQQRVALARAIVNRPKLLLLDEPLSALDMKLRKRMQLELKHLQERLGIAFVFVTHDQEEAMTMADRIVVMNAGCIEQVGTGIDIYRRPATRFVTEFIGDANMIAFNVSDGALRLDMASHAQWPVASNTPARGVAVLRPEQLHVVADPANGAADGSACCMRGVLADIVDIGSHALLYADIGAHRIVARTTSGIAATLRTGADVHLGFDPANVHLIGDAA